LSNSINLALFALEKIATNPYIGTASPTTPGSMQEKDNLQSHKLEEFFAKT
jgi:hypothetical protein